MLTVSELSKVAKITPDTVRHYVRIGLLTPARNPENGYKLFSADDIKRVNFIQLAKTLGFSLCDIKTIFEHSEAGHSPCPAVREMIQKRMEENRRKLDELSRLQQRMDDALLRWRDMPDGAPNGEAICHLIESMEYDRGALKQE